MIDWLFGTTIPARLVATWSNYAGPMGRALLASATRPRQSSSEEIQYLLLFHIFLFHIYGEKKKIKGCIEYRRYSFVFSLSHLLLTPILTADVFSQATNKLLALQKTHRWYFVAYFLLVAGFYWSIKGSRILLLWSFYPQSLHDRGGASRFPCCVLSYVSLTNWQP